MLLAAVGGFLDAFTFIRFAVFANAQTGNVVLLAVNAAAGHWHAALARLAPIAAFVVGVLVVEALARPRARQLLRRPLPIVLGVEIVGLLIVSTLPTAAPAWVITVTVSFVAAIQFSTFRMMAGQVYATVLTSGNLRSAAVHLHHWIVDRDIEARANAARFGKVIAAFAVGACPEWADHASNQQRRRHRSSRPAGRGPATGRPGNPPFEKQRGCGQQWFAGRADRATGVAGRVVRSA